jgi:predicted alpha/beta hydrolase family esterase
MNGKLDTKTRLSDLQSNPKVGQKEPVKHKRVAFIFHDAYSSPEDHWYRWLEEELKTLDYEVYIPKFPTPDGQQLDYWMKVFENYRSNITAETIFIGHGIGCVFALRLLEQLTKPIKDCFFVSPYIDLLGHAGFDRISKTFLEGSVDWLAINKSIRTLNLFYSDNDPFVSQKKSRSIHDYVRSELHLISEGGHFDHAQGYGPFPELFDSINKWFSFVEENPLKILSDELKQKDITQKDLTNSVSSASLGLTTFYQDLGNALDNANAKEMSGLLQRERKREVQSKINKRNSFKNKVMAALVGIVIILGIWRLVSFKLDEGYVKEEVTYVGLVESTHKVSIDVKDTAISALSSKLKKAKEIKSSPGEIVWVDFLDGSTILSRVRARDLFDYLGVNNGQVFRQDTDGSFHFGYYQDEEKMPFLMFTTKSLRRTLGSMEGWAPEIYDDLGVLLDLPDGYVVADNFTQIQKDNSKYWLLEGYQSIQSAQVSRETSTDLPQKSSLFSVEPTLKEFNEEEDKEVEISKQNFDTPIVSFSLLTDSIMLITPNPDLNSILYNKLLERNI